MSGFYFGPLGGMVPLVVAAGVQVETARASSEFISSGGVRYVQRGRAAPRTWNVSRQWQEPEWARMLDLAAHGLIGESWLYDVAGARENMIPASMSAGSGATVLVNSIPMGALKVGHQVSLPVLAGRLYSVSAWSLTSSNVANVFLDGTQSGSVIPSNGMGSYSFTPQKDSIAKIVVTGSSVSGLRMNEGAFDGKFTAGHGTPCRVFVRDPSRTLQLVAGETRSDYQVALVEVGKPGTV